MPTTFRGLWILLPLGLIVGSAGCGKREQALAPPKPAEVVVSPVVVREVTDFEDFTGHTKAVMETSLKARVTGYLAKVNFKDGAVVKTGDVLFEIDPRMYEAELARAQAMVVQAEAQLKVTQSNYHRALDLRGSRTNSQEEFDKAAGDKDVAEANLKSAEASRKIAETNMDWTRVTAPFDGVLSDRRIDPGNLVKADDTELTRIITPDPIYVYFDIDERTLLRIRRLMREGKLQYTSRDSRIKIKLSLSDEEDFSLEGVIDFADNTLDSGTGTLRVRGIFDNPPAPPKRLLDPGMFVRVRLPIGASHESVVVPERALGSDQGKKFVYVVDAQKEVVYRNVKVGALNKGFRVIEPWSDKDKTGLKPGELVIVNGLQRVRPRAKVDAKVQDVPAFVFNDTFFTPDSPIRLAGGEPAPQVVQPVGKGVGAH